MIFPPEPSKECVKVSHVIFECRVINHHPIVCKIPLISRALGRQAKRATIGHLVYNLSECSINTNITYILITPILVNMDDRVSCIQPIDLTFSLVGFNKSHALIHAYRYGGPGFIQMHLQHVVPLCSNNLY